MSDKGNDIWLESAKETFDEAVDAENWSLARNLIEDVRDEGFKSQARTMEQLLLEAQNNV